MLYQRGHEPKSTTGGTSRHESRVLNLRLFLPCKSFIFPVFHLTGVSMLTTYASLAELVEALKNDQIPTSVVSPGSAAHLLGTSRQLINYYMKTGALDVWKAEGNVLISIDSIRAMQKRRLDIPESQQELPI